MANYTSSHQGSWHDDQFIKTGVFDKIYPVGSIYMSVNSTNPSSLFGGTWVQIKDTFLLAAGTTYSAGTTGGAATVTLTKEQMPTHYHHSMQWGVNSGNYFGVNSDTSGGGRWKIVYTSEGSQANFYTSSDGGSQPHNNMPPYLTVYMWKRTA